jgi:hypothetical protein
MPLKGGSSKEVISANIEHCMAKYKETGNVSGNPVESTKKAMQICSAMAYSSARESAKGPALSKAIKEKLKK